MLKLSGDFLRQRQKTATLCVRQEYLRGLGYSSSSVACSRRGTYGPRDRCMGAGQRAPAPLVLQFALDNAVACISNCPQSWKIAALPEPRQRKVTSCHHGRAAAAPT